MNTEKLSPFEGLRLVANAAKGYIAQQIAAIAGTVEGIVDDLNTSITKLEGEMPHKLSKVAADYSTSRRQCSCQRKENRRSYFSIYTKPKYCCNRTGCKGICGR